MREAISSPKQENAYSKDGKYFIRLRNGSTGTEVSQEIARKIAFFLNAQIRGDENPDSESGKHIADHSYRMNCHGAAQAIFDIEGDAVDLNASQIREACEVVSPFQKYNSADELNLALNKVGTPVIIGVGFSNANWIDHSAVFLGSDESGRGVIFQKDNIGLNQPWRLLSTNEFFDEYGEGKLVLRRKIE